MGEWMRTVLSSEAHKAISEQKANVPQLVKEHKPTDAEQGMYVAFRIANKCIAECSKATPHWRDAKQNPPKRNGLFLVTVKTPTGELKTRSVFYMDGKWTRDYDITHWTLMPPPCKEESNE